jgi:hypothetical protein
MEIPEEITPEQAKIGILGLAAIVGGFAVANAAVSKEEEIKSIVPDNQTPLGGLVAFSFANLGVILTGKAFKEAIDEYGGVKIALILGGIGALALVVRAVRN